MSYDRFGVDMEAVDTPTLIEMDEQEAVGQKLFDATYNTTTESDTGKTQTAKNADTTDNAAAAQAEGDEEEENAGKNTEDGERTDPESVEKVSENVDFDDEQKLPPRDFDEKIASEKFKELSSDNADTRAQAQKVLESMGRGAIKFLEQQSLDSKDSRARALGKETLKNIVENDPRRLAYYEQKSVMHGTAFTEQFDKKKAEGFIKDLSSNDSGVRERAQENLKAMGPKTLDLLNQTIKNTDSAAAKSAAKETSDWIEKTDRKEQLQALNRESINKASQFALEPLERLMNFAGHGTRMEHVKNPLTPKPVPQNEIEAMEKAIAAADKVAQSPGFAKETGAMFWRSKGADELPEHLRDAARKDGENWGNRIYANMLSKDGHRLIAEAAVHGDAADKAKGVEHLTRDLMKNPSAASDRNFLVLADKLGAFKNEAFKKAFARLGEKP